MAEEGLPACCIPSENASLGEIAYCGYCRGGDPARRGLTFDDRPCLPWDALGDNVRDKWEAGVAAAVEVVLEEYKKRLIPMLRETLREELEQFYRLQRVTFPAVDANDDSVDIVPE